jgi:NADH-quinone oxidoreductase subunit J
MTFFGTIFYILGAIVLVATGFAVTRRDPFHAVVYLIISFLGTALLFYLLGAPLLAVFEVIIYAGAIMVLFLFIIMTLGRDEPPRGEGLLRLWGVPLVLGLVSLTAAGFLIFAPPGSGVPLEAAMASPLEFGRVLFSRYWLAIEVVSLLLFVALVGALYLARRETPDSTATGGSHDRPL